MPAGCEKPSQWLLLGIKGQRSIGKKSEDLFWSRSEAPRLLGVPQVCAFVKAHAKGHLQFVHFFTC